jgi:FecR protein.
VAKLVNAVGRSIMLLSLPATSQLVSEGLSVRKIINLPALSIASAFILVCCSVSIFGQNREKFVISAKAGGINAVTGQAAMHAKGESDWQQLMITDDLQAGDRVRTALDGRVEILLNPGSYLRLGGDSEVELANNSLANLEVRLLRGTAIVEASGFEESQMMINISTPHARLAIDRQGLYRLNVVPSEATEVIVRKGRVILGDSNTKIKSGNKVTFSATSVSVAKLTNEEKRLEKEVAIEQWSKDRAQMLAKANSRINGRLLNSAFDSVGNDFFFTGFLRSGLWFYNSRTACYTYLPYGYGSSPYGISYPTTVYGGLSHGGYYPGAAYGANSRPSPSTGGGYSNPISSGVSSSSSAAPVRTMPASAPPRDMDSGSSSPRGFRSERTVEPGRP